MPCIFPYFQKWEGAFKLRGLLSRACKTDTCIVIAGRSVFVLFPILTGHRGTFSWGNTGVNKAGAGGIISSPPTSSGAWNGGIKNLTSGVDVGSPLESSQWLSSGNATRPPLSAPTIATATAWGSSAKTQAHVQVESSDFTVVPIESVAPGSKENLHQHNEILSNPVADGTVREDLEWRPHSGAGFGLVPCHEGSQNPGDDLSTSVSQQLPQAGVKLPVGVAPHSGSLFHEVWYPSVGIPHYNSPHNKAMVLAGMANKPILYESCQSHLTPVACFGQSAVYGSHRPQTRNAEQFATSGNLAAANSSGTTDMRTGLFTMGNKLERGGFCDSGQDLHTHRDGQLGADQGYLGLYRDLDTYCDMVSMSTQKNEWDCTRSHNHVNKSVDFVKQDVVSFAKHVPEKKVILLTKHPRGEAQKTGNLMNNSTLLPFCDQGSYGQELVLSEQLDIKSESRVNDILLKVKGVKNGDEITGSKKVDGCEVRGSTKGSRFDNQDIDCAKDEILETETGTHKLWSAGVPSSTFTLTIPNENMKNAELHFPSKHDGEVDPEGYRGKSARQSRKIAIQGGLEPGIDGQPVCDVPIKHIITEDLVHRDSQKLHTKARNRKTEKSWRPKSPVRDSVLVADASSSQTAGEERTSGKNCGKVTDRGESSQGCNTGDVFMLDASTLLQKKKTCKWRNVQCLSNSLSGLSSKVETHSLSVAFNHQQPEIVGCDIDQLTESKNGRDTLKGTSSCHACSMTLSISQGSTAEAFNFTETDTLSQRKAKGRPSYHKAEKEWRPISPAVEVITSTSNEFQSQANQANIMLLPIFDNNPMITNHELKLGEQEGPQVLDTYDYERQRARLKEIAAQRAKQRGREEEERTREQKAKARAKLEELEKRAKSNSTSIEVNEHAIAVLMDEAPNKKAKKRLTLSRGPSTDVSLHNSEKQHLDETSRQPMVDNKEAANIGEAASYHSRNKMDGFDKSSLNVMENHEPVISGTSSSPGERRISRRHSQEGLPCAQDTEADSISSESYGVKKDEAVHHLRPQRHKRGGHNQVRGVASNRGIERKSLVHAIEELKGLKLVPQVPESVEVRSKSEITGRGWSPQSNAEEMRKPKAEELLASEEEPRVFDSCENNSGLILRICAGEGLQTKGGKVETNFVVEQARRSETKQLVEPITGSCGDFSSEKIGQLHGSWRQKNLLEQQLQPDNGKTNSIVQNGRQSALGESWSAPTLSRKPWKKKNGGKQSPYGQQGLIEVERFVIGERNTHAVGPMNFEFRELNHEAEVNAIEHVKEGDPSNSLWGGRNVRTGGRTFKAEAKNPGLLGVTNEGCQEISDPSVPYTLISSQTSYPHNTRNNAKHSPKSAFGKSQWHRSQSMKSTSDSKAGSQTLLEENTVVSASWQRARSSAQRGNNEQEAEIVSANHPRKRGSRSQADAKLPVVTPHYEHQYMHSMGVAELVSDLSISGTNRLNHSNSETCRTIKSHRVSMRAFSPYDHHEAEFEHRGEQHLFYRGNRVRRPSSRANKPASPRQLNGCSSAAELDRKDAETAIKTEMSY
ncbi:hypothetical protein GOP47_0018806 [Adiantum capillus-veneris]|uniref:Uncharacterized protein n=1 Tax=Adiantum capillus-veneris TaxID=13818 RepID=A0A9D4UEE4_ADICA|nr:hypothetical protein GOP47_0018806 [Adiantum capillus-veneris]